MTYAVLAVQKTGHILARHVQSFEQFAVPRRAPVAAVQESNQLLAQRARSNIRRVTGGAIVRSGFVEEYRLSIDDLR